MCNTREENAAELAQEAAIPVIPITCEALCEKMAEYRIANWDPGDTRDAILEGRIGFYEMTNAELEEMANDDYMLTDDDMNEVRYTITDADTSAPSDEKNTQIVKDIVDLLDGTEWGSQTLDDIANLLREGGYQIRDPFYSAGPVSEEN